VLRERYRGLLTSNGCEVDEDCEVLSPLPLPSESAYCGRYVNGELVADQRIALFQAWQNECVTTSSGSGCFVSQPAVCRRGRCEATCPSTDVPQCPQPCPLWAEVSRGERCNSGVPCMLEDGEVCTCNVATSLVECSPPATAAADCPLICLRASGIPSSAAGRPAF
jgi:hypothetical protein